MSDTSAAMATILLVEDDEELLTTLEVLIAEVGYGSASALNAEEALACLAQDAFNLVLADLLDATPHGEIPLTMTVVRAAHPTPTALLTAWTLADDWTHQHTFAFIVRKPFDLNDLLTRVAELVSPEVSSEQSAHDAVVRRYFAALEQHDWVTLRGLCTPDVRYALENALAPISGIDAYIAYAQQRMRSYPHARYPQIVTYPMPSGLAARFVSAWEDPLDAGVTSMGAGGVVFQFSGERIAQIGVSVPTMQLSTANDPESSAD